MKDFRPKQLKYFIVFVVMFVCYALFMSWQFKFIVIDDAYISFRYGKNLMSGNGLVYNSGEPVEGYTNFLYTLLTAPFTKLQFADISVFAIIIGLIFSVLNLFLIYRISVKLKDFFTGKSFYVLIFPAVLVAIDNSTAFWAVAGMETPMFVFFILLSFYYYFSLSENRKNIYYLAVSCVLCTLTRPEGNMIFALILAGMLLFRKQTGAHAKQIITFAAIYLVLTAVYYILKYLYYGSFLPNTFYAKGSADFADNFYTGYLYAWYCLKVRYLVLLLILFIPLRFVKDYRIFTLMVFTALYIFYIIYVGGDWPAGNRFIVPVLPALYILSTIGLCALIEKLSKVKFFRPFPFKINFIVLAVYLAAVVLINTMSVLEYTFWITQPNINTEEEYVSIGNTIKRTMPPDTRIAIGAAGKLAYYSDMYAIDMFGLNDKKIASEKTKAVVIAHKKYDFEYVMSLKPDLIITYVGYKDYDVPDTYEKLAPGIMGNTSQPVFRLKK